MIAKYYDPKRGDIIFNPFDARSHAWDFWSDCAQLYMLEHFANILIGFNNRQNARQTNDFWEEASQTIFVALTKKMQNENDLSLRKLLHILSKSDRQTLYDMLSDTDAGKYFAKDNAKTVASINSVLMANIKPLRFLSEMDTKQKFTIEQYLKNISTGNSESWLFLSACPSARNLTLPLTSCLLELIVSKIMNQAQAQNQQKIWFIIDELASLGRMPSLNILMQEGRKYGACVVSGMQSISQLYAYYGEADASNLIGLFRTKFAFGSDDPKMADLYGKLFGISTVISQQKNTSFGANEFRDGVSYNEKHDNLPLVSYQDLTKLQMGECFVLLPESDVRVARLEVPLATNRDENSWFVENTKSTFLNNSKSSALVSELAKTPEQISENSAVFFETDITASAQIEEKTSLSAKEFDFVN
jgi:type IV secretory pathway TraG/TraD family ATPase VirD4